MTPTEPVDRTHAESVAAVAAIRTHVSRLHEAVAAWDLTVYQPKARKPKRW